MNSKPHFATRIVPVKQSRSTPATFSDKNLAKKFSEDKISWFFNVIFGPYLAGKYLYLSFHCLEAMFFFFVGGVEQQVKQVLKPSITRCIRCGSRASLVEYENVLKLFFVPVWRWPGKNPAVYCDNCSLLLPERFIPLPENEDSDVDSRVLSDVLRCHSCARLVEPEFKFCPFCGSSL
ncbi:uncharacterized protein LOC18436733 [Amborella trichopoda]|nr:uncharacterized protein LOC18436733 [Amborella trichopoda]|eukprot:XP_011624338.1 uncharacterized protein LOC18436733 [Amborella trichopoda]